MVMRSRLSGVTFMETICALSLLAAIGGTLAVGGPLRDRIARDGLRQTVALRVASSHLESLTGALPAGTTAHEVDAASARSLPGARLTRSVRRTDDGLLEVTVQVRWDAPGDARDHVTLVTLVDPEGVR